jgi:hypothetical protein
MDDPARSLFEQFARRDDPPHRPSEVLFVVGEADRSYLETVVSNSYLEAAAWNPVRVVRHRYETLLAQARRQLREEDLRNTTWGYDQGGRIVILTGQTYERRPAYFVEWPSSLPEAPYPDGAYIVGNDVLRDRLGERPVYIRYPDGAFDLLPLIPGRIWQAPPFKWGYPGTGTDRLEDAIENACCSDILDKAPRRYLGYARSTLERVVEKNPAAETLEIQIGEIRGWYTEALAREL